jgi:hypothetical protein
MEIIPVRYLLPGKRVVHAYAYNISPITYIATIRGIRIVVFVPHSSQEETRTLEDAVSSFLVGYVVPKKPQFVARQYYSMHIHTFLTIQVKKRPPLVVAIAAAAY